LHRLDDHIILSHGLIWMVGRHAPIIACPGLTRTDVQRIHRRYSQQVGPKERTGIPLDHPSPIAHCEPPGWAL